MNPRPALKLTEGVLQDSQGFSHAELGVYGPREHPRLRTELLDSGLASELSAPWWRCRSRATALRLGVVAGGLGSLVHNTRGMALPLGACMVTAALSAATGAIGIAGIAVAALILAASILVHELGHVVAFRLVSPGAPAVTVSAGIRCHLVRRGLSGWREIAIVVCGPFAPAMLCPILLPCADALPFLFWGWAAVSAGHAVMLLFPVGDGENLRRTLTEHRGK